MPFHSQTCFLKIPGQLKRKLIQDWGNEKKAEQDREKEQNRKKKIGIFLFAHLFIYIVDHSFSVKLVFSGSCFCPSLGENEYWNLLVWKIWNTTISEVSIEVYLHEVSWSFRGSTTKVLFAPRWQDGRMKFTHSSQKTYFLPLVGCFLSLQEHTKLCHLVVQRFSTWSGKLSFLIWIILTAKGVNAAPLGQAQGRQQDFSLFLQQSALSTTCGASPVPVGGVQPSEFGQVISREDKGSIEKIAGFLIVTKY